MKYKKGDKLLIAATYEVEVVLDEDSSENGLYNLVTDALLNTGNMDAHLNVISVLGVNSSSDDNGEEDPELPQGVSRETVDTGMVADEDEDEEEEDEDWQEREKREEATRVWDELREGKEFFLTNHKQTAYPDLTEKQIRFIIDALDSGLEVKTYSGRFMYGEYCPSVRVDHPSELRTHVPYRQDQFGLGLVLYCPRN